MKLKTFFPCLTWMCPFQYAELCCIYSEPIAKCLVWNTGLMSPETRCWSPWQPKELCLVPSWKKACGMLNSGLQYIAGCFFIYLTPHCCLQLFPNTFEKKTTTKIKGTPLLLWGSAFSSIPPTFLSEYIYLAIDLWRFQRLIHVTPPHKFWVALTTTQMPVQYPASQLLGLIPVTFSSFLMWWLLPTVTWWLSHYLKLFSLQGFPLGSMV